MTNPRVVIFLCRTNDRASYVLSYGQPLVSMHLTRCVSFSFCFFKFLIFETAIYANKDAYNGVTRVLDAWQQKHEMRPRWGGSCMAPVDPPFF